MSMAGRPLGAASLIDRKSVVVAGCVVAGRARLLPVHPFVRIPPARSATPSPPSAATTGVPRELPLLLTLAAVQFTHIVDFMIMMPLGPQFMRLFAIGPQQFGFMVSAYTFAAAASGFVAAFWIDRFDRRRALLWLYAGFIVATALCGIAPDYPLLLVARIVAGTFGGVLGGLTFADRRRPRSVCPPGDGDGRRRGGIFAGGGGRRAAVAVDRGALLVARAVPRARRVQRPGRARGDAAAFRRWRRTSPRTRAVARWSSCGRSSACPTTCAPSPS